MAYDQLTIFVNAQQTVHAHTKLKYGHLIMLMEDSPEKVRVLGRWCSDSLSIFFAHTLKALSFYESALLLHRKNNDRYFSEYLYHFFKGVAFDARGMTKSLSLLITKAIIQMP